MALRSADRHKHQTKSIPLSNRYHAGLAGGFPVCKWLYSPSSSYLSLNSCLILTRRCCTSSGEGVMLAPVIAP